jgi:P4 family phage/plasmid primase-like protien
MREAMEIFFDPDFTKQIDSNPHLLCFNNGVFDFKNKEFRQGYPHDYISKTTGVNYIPYDYNSTKEISDDIMSFMEKLFPLNDLCRYMWDHLSSCLIGIKKEHAFNIYRGSGSNGKSILTDLMSQALGEYKGTVPITLVTEKRGSIGGTSSEVIQLKGVRYAVMQEPSKDAVINEGILKELTGGDPIQARALYSDSEIFIPQFSLVVCTNALFDVKSNDDGTWRRMKLVDFLSKFISEGETHTDDTQYVFPKDKSLKEKLPLWAPVFIAMLVKRACETEGEVKDCGEVVAASNKYRQSQYCISGIIAEENNTTQHANNFSK